MGESGHETILTFFKALADESRLKMAGLLAHREYSVEELAAALALKSPTVSHHLNVLRGVGLVHERHEGTTHYYRLDLDALRRMHEATRPEKIAVASDVATDGAWERKIMQDFLVGDRLQIPSSRKKRDVILGWLAERFDIGVQYPEQVVNEIIKRHHEDSATLRRELIGGGWMARENGIYWRTPGNPSA